MSDLFKLAAGMMRDQAQLQGIQPPKPHPADQLWLELTSLYRECNQLKNQFEAKKRRMRRIAYKLKAMAKAKNLPGIA